MSQKSGPTSKLRAPRTANDGVCRKRAKKSEDVVLIHGVSEDGNAMAVLRARDDRVEAGIMRPVREGQPLEGELLTLKPRPEFPLLCDVEAAAPALTASGGSDQQPSRGGPAQVATASYRANWDAIWSKRKKALPN